VTHQVPTSAKSVAPVEKPEGSTHLTRPDGHKRYLGFVLGLIAGAAWGTTSLGSRYLAHSRDIFPPLTVFWRFALALPLLLVAYRLWTRNDRRFEWRDLPRVIGLALLGIFLMANFAFAATRYTTNVNTTIIVTASAVLIALTVYFMGARVSKAQWVGIVAGLIGVVLIGFAKNPDDHGLSICAHTGGIILATLASLSWALYTVFGRGLVAKYGGLKVTVWTITAGTLMQLPLALHYNVWSVAGTFSMGDWAVLAYLAVFPTAIAFVVWFMALKYVDVTTLGMTQYVGPVISAALGWLWLGEKIMWEHIVGSALIFVGLKFAAGRPREILTSQK
jgi:drug/metabolite transporter (DMT)-like permease